MSIRFNLFECFFDAVKPIWEKSFFTDKYRNKIMFPSYRNQSVDWICKSTDWFLFDGNIYYIFRVNATRLLIMDFPVK